MQFVSGGGGFDVQAIERRDHQGRKLVRSPVRRTGRGQRGEVHRGSQGEPEGSRGAFSGELRRGRSAGKHRRGHSLSARGRFWQVNSPLFPERNSYYSSRRLVFR